MAGERGHLSPISQSVQRHLRRLFLPEAVRGISEHNAQSPATMAGFREYLYVLREPVSSLCRSCLTLMDLLTYHRAVLTRSCQIITMDEKHMQFILATGYEHFWRGVRQKERM